MASETVAPALVGPGKIIATAQIMDHALTNGSKGTAFDYSKSRFTFPNRERDRFVDMLTDVTKNTFSTTTTIAIDWGDDWVELRNKALDTGPRLFPADNFNIAIVTVD